MMTVQRLDEDPNEFRPSSGNEWPKGEPKENWDWEAGTPLSWVLATTSRGGFLFATSFRVEHSRAYREGAPKAL